MLGDLIPGTSFGSSLANLRGRAQIAGARVRAYNRWTDLEFEQYTEFLDDRNDRRSQYNWVLDVSCVAKTLLTIQDKWQIQDNGFLSCMTKTGMSETMLLGAAWQHRGIIHPSISPDVGYCE